MRLVPMLLLGLAACADPSVDESPGTPDPAADGDPTGVKLAHDVVSTDAKTAFTTGLDYHRRARYVDAEAAFRRALDLAPDSSRYHYYLGAALHAQSRFAEAEDTYTRALELSPDDPAPRIALGKLRYDVMGDVEGASVLLREALEIDPGATEARYVLGLIEQREGRPQEAAEIFASILAVEREYKQARTHLGMCYLQAGDYDRALVTLKQAVRASPYDPTGYLGLSQVLLRKGQTEMSQRMLARSEQLRQQEGQLEPHLDVLLQNPDLPQAHYNVGVVYARMGRLAQAETHFLESLVRDSTYALAHQGLGNLYLDQGDEDRAVSQYLQALARDSTLAEAHNNLGMVYHKIGEVAAAVAAYEAAVRMSPAQGFLYANLARGYRDLGRVAQARASLQKALELEPSLQEASKLLDDLADVDGGAR